MSPLVLGIRHAPPRKKAAMNETKAIEPFRFKGTLRLGDNSVAVSFQAHVDRHGELVMAFEELSLSDETHFILTEWHREGSQITYFNLSGEAENSVSLYTDRLYFNSIGPHSDSKRGAYFVFDAACEVATLRRKATTPSPAPVYLLALQAFQCLPQVTAACPLGELVAGGDVRETDLHNVTGYIQLRAHERPADLAQWQAEAKRLLDHVRRVMSFASGINLADPTLTLFLDDDVEISVQPHTPFRAPPIPAFPIVGRDDIFSAAVTSFFAPPFDAKNLWMALEWIAMEATYNEVRLVNAMTALENLVSSNTRDSRQLLDDTLFAKLKSALTRTIKDFAEKNDFQTNYPKLADEMTTKLAELQRRSLRRKLDVLLERWSVPMEGITKVMIRSAFNARNEIIHEGRYYVEGEIRPELWGHYCVVREIVTRLIFSAIGFRGRYISHLGGYHEASFPPRAGQIDQRPS
jgi:hypothetical protein